jgi:hypothetical protein
MSRWEGDDEYVCLFLGSGRALKRGPYLYLFFSQKGVEAVDFVAVRALYEPFEEYAHRIEEPF